MIKKTIFKIVFKRSLKQVLGHGLILPNVHKVIQLNQEALLLKECIDMNTELRKQAKHFEKRFL